MNIFVMTKVKKVYLIYSILCLASLLPIINYFGNNNQIQLDFIVAFLVSTILGVTLMLKNNGKNIDINIFSIVFFIAITLSLILNLMTNNKINLEVSFKWLCVAFLFQLWRSTFSHQEIQTVLKWFFFSNLLFHSAWVLIQFVDAGYRTGVSITGFFGNSGVLANYLLLLWPFPIAFLVGKNSNINRIIIIALIIISSIAIILLTARATWLGMLAALLVITLLNQKNSRLRKLITVLFSCIMGGVGFASFQLKHASALGRLHILSIDFQMVKASFPLGIGLGGVYSKFNVFQSYFFENNHTSLKQQMIAYDTFEAFNSFIQTVIELGLIGAIFYLILVYYIINSFFVLVKSNNKKPIAIGSIATVTGLLVSSLLSNPFHHWPIIYWSCCVVALLPIAPIKIKLKISYKINLLMSILASFIIYRAVLYVQALFLWHEAANYALNNDFGKANILYKKACVQLYNNEAFLFNYGCELFIAGRNPEAIIVLEQCNTKYNSSLLYCYLGKSYQACHKFNKAANAYKRALFINPSLLLPRHLTFLLYVENREYSKAIQEGQALLAYPIKIYSNEAINIKLDVNKKLILIGAKSIPCHSTSNMP